MATRLYVVDARPEYTPPTLKANWFTRTGQVYTLSPAKYGGQIAPVGIAEGNWIFSEVQSALLFVAVSDRLQAQAVGGNLDFLFGVATNVLQSHDNWHIHAYITIGDTDGVRGTILSEYAEYSNQWPYGVVTPTRLQAGGGALVTVNAQLGDRLVVEVGYVARVVTSPGAAGFIYVGTQRPTPESGGSVIIPALDLTTGGDPGTRAGFIDFSVNVALEPKPARLEHEVTQVVRAAEPAPSQVLHSVIQVVSRPPTGEPSQLFHMIVQTVQSAAIPLSDLSGIYFLNTQKVERHDSYYGNQELKIPNPTIRTALLGE